MNEYLKHRLSLKNKGAAEKRPGIKRNNKKRAKENAEYLKLVKKFLFENTVCVVTGERATEVHHAKGRIGKLLLDVSKWLPVSAVGHKWIHDNPKEAMKRGLILSRLKV